MITLEAIVVVLALAFTGTTLHRALALSLMAHDSTTAGTPAPSGRDLVLLGILPGFAIVGTIGIYLALFQLLRPDVLAVTLAAALVWRRKDARATIEEIWSLARDGVASFKRCDAAAIAASVALLFFVSVYLLNAQVPYDNIDITAFQLPLARSIVEHSGFVYPQIENIFYSYNPLFFNLLFAEPLLFVNWSIAPAILNIAIFLGFIVALTTFFRAHRAVALLLALSAIAFPSLFSTIVPAPLVDIPRSCYSVLGLLFAYRYMRAGLLCDIVSAGLCSGAAIGGHYLELVPLAVLGVTLLPRLRQGRAVWLHAAAFAATLIIVAGYWYLRNWVIQGNPIWPLLFGHAGISDQDMAEFVRESTVPKSFEDHSVRPNIFSLGDWFSIVHAHWRWIFTALAGAFSGATVAAVVLLGRARVGVLIVWSAVMLVLWYFLMRHLRWALPSLLLLCSTAIIAAGPHLERLPKGARVAFKVAPAARSVAAALGIAFIAAVGVRISFHGMVVLPTWANTGLARALAFGGSAEDYLESKEPGYRIYRLVATKDLHMVFQPFDEDSITRSAAFNDGRSGGWFLSPRELPKSASDLDAFLARHRIRYFIDQPVPQPDPPSLLTPEHVAIAHQIIATLRTRAKPLLTDRFGWSLYELVEPVKPQ
jgi:hypothetical protein